MKTFDTNQNYFSAFELNDLNGIEETKEFLNSLFIETISAFKRYYEHQPDDSKEYGFDYGEQSLKTYITIALDRVSNGNLIQEIPLTRNYYVREDDEEYEQSQGFLDFWAGYKDCNFLIELKHSWSRYYQNSKSFEFNKKTVNRFHDSITQIDSIDAKSWYSVKKHLFGISLIVIPLYSRVGKIRKMKINKDTIDNLFAELKYIGGNAVGIWSLEKDYLKLIEINSGENSYSQFYPGVIFIVKVKKYSRK